MKNDGIKVFYNGKKWGEEKTFLFGFMTLISTVSFGIVVLFGTAVVIGLISKLFYMFFKFGWGLWF